MPTRRCPTVLDAAANGRVDQAPLGAPRHAPPRRCDQGGRLPRRPTAPAAVAVEADLHRRREQLDRAHRQRRRQAAPVEAHGAPPKGRKAQLRLVEKDGLPDVLPAAAGSVAASAAAAVTAPLPTSESPPQPRVAPQVAVAVLRRHVP